VGDRVRVSEVVVVIALVAAGAALRWWHVGTPSLWWDELVHVRTAEQPTVGAVWVAARDGGAPGSGNAGAVPLDYLALHAWLRATPAPAPHRVERHVRTPAFAFAALALPAAWWVARVAAGPAAGVTALALLATSLPHVLYAAEARFYSLYVLATLASLGAFAALLDRPTIGRGALFVAVNGLYALSALYGVFPIAAEHAVLAILAWRRRAEPGGRVLAATLACGAAAALVLLGLWLSPSAVTSVHPRGAPVDLDVASAARATLAFLSGGSVPLAWTLAAGVALAPWVATRGTARALGWTIALSAAALVAIVALARWKHYYYHPRHAAFLLPMSHLAVAIAVARVGDAVRRPGLVGGVAVAAALAVATPTVATYVANPLPFFHGTKTLRDFRGLATALAERTRTLGPDERYLLVVEKRRPGHLANPMVAWYLKTLGLLDRVMVLGVGDPAPLVATLAQVCERACDRPLDVAFLARLGLRDPFDQPPAVRRLLSLALPPPGRRVGGIGVVAWAPNVPATTPPGLRTTRLDGLALYEAAPR
jgi:hypothetical protein